MLRVYTHRRHGSLLVEVSETTYRLFRDETPEEFPTARQLLIAIHGRDPHVTFERYFRLGHHARPKPPSNLLSRFLWKPKPPLGIDLESRSEEVAKLLRAVFGGVIRANGYDFSEVLQEVYVGLLVRNNGKCPWDPRISTFGFYVTMVCRGVLSNYGKKTRRRRAQETVGTWDLGKDGWEPTDVSLGAVADPSYIEERSCLVDLSDWLRLHKGTGQADARLAQRILPLVAQGMKRGEIAQHVGVKAPTVGRALTWLRGATSEWLVAAG